MEASPDIVSTPQWSIRLAEGWRAEDRSDHVAVLNSHPRTHLLFTTFDPAASRITARRWVEMAASVHPPKGRPLVEVRCGEFTGFRTEFASLDPWMPPAGDDRWLRGWLLECDGIPLSVNYECPLSAAGRDDRDLRAMLDTLRGGNRG